MIEKKVIVPESIVEFVVSGACNTTELKEIIENEFCKVSKGILWNFAEGSRLNVISQDITMLTNAIKENACHERSAYYAPDMSKYSLLKQYQSYVSMEVEALNIRVFRDYDEAVKWLSE